MRRNAITPNRAGPSATQPDRDLVEGSLAIVLPDEPVSVRLMNTIWADRSGVHDVLTSTANLAAWLAAVHDDSRFMPDARDLQRFRALRDGLRRLAALITDDNRPAAASATTDVHRAVADVNRAVVRDPSLPQLAYDAGALRLTATPTSTEVRQALSSIAQSSVELLAGEGSVALRACIAPGCVLYFVKDHPRREWCSTACGNRARAARHYRRHHMDLARVAQGHQ
jgi:predicted RNA-binding Zn ribbon-like protein